ncbi:hypothetical protein BH24CHL6_BH24CHL6_08200 [soil metagenome]
MLCSVSLLLSGVALPLGLLRLLFGVAARFFSLQLRAQGSSCLLLRPSRFQRGIRTGRQCQHQEDTSTGEQEAEAAVDRALALGLAL